MSTLSRESPIPWRVFVTVSPWCNVVDASGNNVNVDFDSLEDAELIVRAVNAHGLLLEACKAALPYLEGEGIRAKKCNRMWALDLTNKLKAAIAAVEVSE